MNNPAIEGLEDVRVLAGRDPIKTVMLDGVTPFRYRAKDELDVLSVLRGDRYTKRLAYKTVRPVRRVLDLGAHSGEFLCWAFKRWPGCWIDFVEYDQELARLAVANAPPGALLLERGNLKVERYDVVRLGNVPTSALLEVLPLLVDVPVLIADVCEIRGAT